MALPVFICGDCERGSYLRRWLKKRFTGGEVVKTECMGICPKDRVSVCVRGKVIAVDAARKSRRKALLALVTSLLGCAPVGSELPPRAVELVVAVATNGAMVSVAAGPFLAGCDPAQDRLCEADEQPMRTRETGAFAIDLTEVTQGAYAACVRAGACTPPYHGPTPWDGEACVGRWIPGANPSHPIACVTWTQARDFCSWLGKRLPTEWEWEKAARGDDGRPYPWGAEPPSCERASIQRCKDVPVASRTRGRSPYGAYDLAGSVGEWTASEWTDGYYVVRGIEMNATHVEEWDWRAANRFALAPQRISHRIGFRCARDSSQTVGLP